MLFGAALPASATGGSAAAEMTVVPGLDEVTYGQNAAYVATIVNTGSITLKNVTFHNPIPSTVSDGEPQPAAFQSSSCTGTLTETEFVCGAVERLHPDESLTVTIAWKTPEAGSSPDCPEETTCMTNSAFWTASSSTYPMGPVATTLLSEGDDSKAATYALTVCTDPSSPTVATNQAVGPGNPLASAVCASSLPVDDPLHPGLVTSVEELPKLPSEPGIAPEASDICAPAPGFECGETPFVFSPLATFTFVIQNASLPPGSRITSVYHDGVLVSKSKRAVPRVVRIKNEKFKGITTITVLSPTNGRWTFG
jgi:uncharacterized repeat protein (TIGR01451 family)